MSGFTKLFSDIVDSSIWDQDAETCKVWVTLLALSDETGFVRGSVGWLAHKAKVSEDVCSKSLLLFESPDPTSRTTTNDGKRIKTVERGWFILNYDYFRNQHRQLSSDPRKIYKREWMRKKRMSTSCPQESTDIHTASASASAYRVEGVGEGSEPRAHYPEASDLKFGNGKPTLEQVLVWADQNNAVRWLVENEWLRLQDDGWVDHKGKPLRHWQSWFKMVRNNWENEGRPMTEPPDSYRKSREASEAREREKIRRQILR